MPDGGGARFGREIAIDIGPLAGRARRRPCRGACRHSGTRPEPPSGPAPACIPAQEPHAGALRTGSRPFPPHADMSRRHRCAFGPVPAMCRPSRSPGRSSALPGEALPGGRRFEGMPKGERPRLARAFSDRGIPARRACCFDGRSPGSRIDRTPPPSHISRRSGSRRGAFRLQLRGQLRTGARRLYRIPLTVVEDTEDFGRPCQCVAFSSARAAAAACRGKRPVWRPRRHPRSRRPCDRCQP